MSQLHRSDNGNGDANGAMPPRSSPSFQNAHRMLSPAIPPCVVIQRPRWQTSEPNSSSEQATASRFSQDGHHERSLQVPCCAAHRDQERQRRQEDDDEGGGGGKLLIGGVVVATLGGVGFWWYKRKQAAPAA